MANFAAGVSIKERKYCKKGTMEAAPNGFQKRGQTTADDAKNRKFERKNQAQQSSAANSARRSEDLEHKNSVAVTREEWKNRGKSDRPSDAGVI
ncbi:hypothetical protein L596_023634 [Steinernema carpocapsae]|uniref:Uncharacterized protein n=1 Tax=Steinernema carpocapsae TaxID=34508 RepID=A0A4V5ZZH1_STECR|nr:hypothetical protein L596_023634 [Steinernema carpocapsae]